MTRFFALPLVALLVGASVWAFQDPGGAQAMPQPSAEHKALHRSVGTWDATIDMMGQTSKGSLTIELGPGGFSVFSHFTGTVMGGPFEGRGIDGYDPGKKKYVSWWTDSMAPAPGLTEGTWDEKTQTMTMQGDMPDMTGKMVKHRLVTKWTSNDTMDFEIFAPGPDGKEMGGFKIHYTRKK